MAVVDRTDEFHGLVTALRDHVREATVRGQRLFAWPVRGAVPASLMGRGHSPSPRAL